MGNKVDNPYIILPFHYMRFKKDFMLMVNLAGEHLYVPADDFNKVVNYSLNLHSDIYFKLKAKHFITNTLSDPSIELLAIKYRTKKIFFLILHLCICLLLH